MAYLVFWNSEIVGYFSVPSIADFFIHAGANKSMINMVTTSIANSATDVSNYPFPADDGKSADVPTILSVFIGSSTECLKISQTLQENLEHYSENIVWNQTSFDPGKQYSKRWSHKRFKSSRKEFDICISGITWKKKIKILKINRLTYFSLVVLSQNVKFSGSSWKYMTE